MSATPELRDVAAVAARLSPFDWRWADAERAALDARWRAMARDNPAMFDGRVLLAHRWRFAGERFEAEFFETGFSRFIGWRDMGCPDPAVANCFAMAALRGADGAFLLGEMAAGTANTGKIYFPAGTPDRGDVVGESVDLAASALRELCEETGLTEADVEVEDRWCVLRHGQRLACLRPMACRAPADAVAATIHAALERQSERELARMHVVRRTADIDARRMPPFIVAYLEDALARG
ncbi:MAG: NUDIX hydrolase [Methylobacteriaceae bacterium]|nr:NUDIX hydrolase [Methylobacteriaceae bacterium]